MSLVLRHPYIPHIPRDQGVSKARLALKTARDMLLHEQNGSASASCIRYYSSGGGGGDKSAEGVMENDKAGQDRESQAAGAQHSSKRETEGGTKEENGTNSHSHSR